MDVTVPGGQAGLTDPSPDCPASEVPPEGLEPSAAIGRLRVVLQAVALPAALVLLAALIRWPHLLTIPIWTDEGDEARLAYSILRTQVIPLTNDDVYNGPLYNYIVAAALWTFGSFAWLPRLVTLVFGALTIVPTYLLGRELAIQSSVGRPLIARIAGAVAALLLATNAVHIVVNSHVGWGNCITPFFTTMAVWLVQRAFRARTTARPAALCVSPLAGAQPSSHGALPSLRPSLVSGPSLVVGGLMLGLALQTHPTVLTILPAIAAFGLWRGGGILKSPWPWLAVLAVIVGLGPLVLHAVVVGPTAWYEAASRMQVTYNFGEQLTETTYVERVGRILLTLGASLAGLVNDRQTPFPPSWHPLLLLALGLAILGLGWLWRRGVPLPALLVLSALLCLPAVQGTYDPIVMRARYIGALPPVVFGALGALVAAFVAGPQAPRPGVADEESARQLSTAPPAGLWLLPSLVLPWAQRWASSRLLPSAVAMLAFGSLLSLSAFYADAVRDRRENQRLLAAYAVLLAARQPGETVVLDRNLRGDWTLTEGRLRRVLVAWLELDGVPSTLAEVRPDGELDRVRSNKGQSGVKGGQPVEKESWHSADGDERDLDGDCHNPDERDQLSDDRSLLIVLARGNVPVAARRYDLEEIAAGAAPGSPWDRGYVVARITCRSPGVVRAPDFSERPY
ncbi:MAG: hypothetical protein IT305_08020 [Chloroflexi bacterium]|nr:hypothetical protein [Chloroflexota bacterium]